MLEGLEGVLLIIGGELDSQGNQTSSEKCIIRRGRSGMGLEDCCVSWNAKEEENDVLDNRNEAKVDDLEQPCGNFLTEDSPSVILVTQAEKTTTPSIITQSEHP